MTKKVFPGIPGNDPKEQMHTLIMTTVTKVMEHLTALVPEIGATGSSTSPLASTTAALSIPGLTTTDSGSGTAAAFIEPAENPEGLSDDDENHEGFMELAHQFDELDVNPGLKKVVIDPLLEEVVDLGVKRVEGQNELTPGQELLLSSDQDQIKLHEADVPWRRGRYITQSKFRNNEAAIIESITAEARCILNRLAAANLNKLVPKFLELPFDGKDERISAVVAILFEKVINEPMYAQVYVKLMYEVCFAASRQSQDDTSRKFRKLILDQCEKEFEVRRIMDEAEIKKVQEKLAEATDEGTREQIRFDFEEKKYLAGERALGCARLVGELFKHQMLTPRIIMECIRMMLHSPDDGKLKCLHLLLLVMGEKLDMDLKALEAAAAEGKKLKFIPEKKWMSKIFQQLQNLIHDKKLSTGIRFKLLNLVELRQNSWKPRSQHSLFLENIFVYH